jgi:hypothetical protein
LRLLLVKINLFLKKFLKFLKNNPAAILIASFQVLLLVCAGLFFNGQAASAELLSSAAYFLLFAGVIVQLIFRKRGAFSE